MNHVVAKIQSLAAAPDSVVIAIGTGADLKPWEFLACGSGLWIAPCPCCASGVIETDSPDYAAAKCDSCFDAEPVELSLQAPRPVEPPKALTLVERPSSIVISSGRVPLPKFEDTRLFPAPKPTPTCRKCGRYVCPDNSSGVIPAVCGVCREEKSSAPAAEHRCRQCNESLEGSHSSRVYCDSCVRGRAWIQQKNQSAKRLKERRANRLCQRCGTTPLGANAHPSTKFCPDCRDAAYKESAARHTNKYLAKKKEMKA